MSKLHYLLVILVLTAVGSLIIWQLGLVTDTSYQLISQEVIRAIDNGIKETYYRLHRFPDSDREFETMVLKRLNLHLYPGKVTVEGFKGGGRTGPASFRIRAGAAGKATVVRLLYYGSDYRKDIAYQGKLVYF